MAVEFSPAQALRHTLQYWWIVTVLTIMGGVGGWLYHRSRPPVYQTMIEFTVSVDYTQTGALPERDVDYILGTVGAFLGSIHMKEAVVEAARAQGVDLDLPTLRKISTLERRQTRWQIYIRHTDPQTALQIANLWGEIAYDALLNARQHAIQAQTIQKRLDALAGCVAYPAPDSPQEQTCSFLSAVEFQGEVNVLTRAMESELQASGGIFPNLRFDFSQRAVLPTEPVAFGRGTLVFWGAVIGFVVGGWVVSWLSIRRPRD